MVANRSWCVIDWDQAEKKTYDHMKDDNLLSKSDGSCDPMLLRNAKVYKKVNCV